MRRFSIAGDVAVIDLDAAMGQGQNRAMIEKLVRMGPTRVGGGIRDLETAVRWLDLGVSKIILGTAAKPELLSQLPKERLIAALDARHDEIVVEGWKTGTGRTVLDVMRELRDLVGGFLVTFVEREGRMGGTDFEKARELVHAAGNARVTVAGGVTTPQEIAELDRIGADAQVGMALYSGKMDFAEAITAPLKSDRPDGLWPTVVTDERGVALGLVYSDVESVKVAVDRHVGAYHSRSRGLWIKGETSGATQELLRIDLDCDRDAIRMVVKQAGTGFCHLNTRTCFGDDSGLSRLERVIQARKSEALEGSYTRRLFDEPGLLSAKLLEEAGELTEAGMPEEVCWEAADVLYFTMARMAQAGVTLADVEAELDRRALKITRRKGDAK
jgi:phosphoribosyl-ATP pyrophosphohydrolase